MAITQKEILESINESLDYNNEVFFDGDGAILNGASFIAYALAKELHMFLLPRNVANNVITCDISINASNNNFVSFSSNDLRLYELFFIIMRKARIPSTSEDFLTGNHTKQVISIHVPELSSFKSMSYLLEKIAKFLDIAIHSEKIKDARQICRVKNCGGFAMYYPNICRMHLNYGSEDDIKKMYETGKVKEDLQQLPRKHSVNWVLHKIVPGFKINLKSVIRKYSPDKCFICGDTSHVTHMGLCTECYVYIDNFSFEIDYVNRLATYDKFKKGEWKNYLVVSEEEFNRIREEQRVKKRGYKINEKEQNKFLNKYNKLIGR